MNPPLRVVALLALAGFPACYDSVEYETNTGLEKPGAENVTYDGPGPGGGALGEPISPREVGKVRFPEQFDVQAEWIVQWAAAEEPGSGSEGVEVFREIFHSDGQGSFLLEVTGYSTDPEGGFAEPGLELEKRYRRQQGFYVRYRNLHVTNPRSLEENYFLHVVTGEHQMAGRNCRRYFLRSKRDGRAAEVWVDRESDLMLGWTTWGPEGDFIAHLETTAIDYSPSHAGVEWAEDGPPRIPYEEGVTYPELDVEPLSVRYVPASYYLERRELMDTEGLGVGTNRVYLEIYSDGIFNLFVAQLPGGMTPAFRDGGGDWFAGMPDNSSGEKNFPFLRYSELGPHVVAEGRRFDHQVYVVGTLPMDEITNVYAHMR